MKILIVDDEAKIADGLQCIIKQGLNVPYKIKACCSAKDALQQGALFHPDVVITDIVMPGMDGLTMVKEFQKMEPAPVIIIMSGYDQFSYAQTALRIGVKDYLLKPVDSDHLLGLLMSVYRQLPQNFQQRMKSSFFQLDFFRQDLHNSHFPVSLQRTISYIEQNYMNELTLQNIANEMMLSANYLSTLINDHFGHSFNYLLDCVRLQKACELMVSEPDLVNAEISYLVGYANERRLYHAFQQRLGFTPGHFRTHYAEPSQGPETAEEK